LDYRLRLIETAAVHSSIPIGSKAGQLGVLNQNFLNCRATAGETQKPDLRASI